MELFKTDLEYKQLNFGCNAKMEGYANSSSHIPKLSEIAGYMWKDLEVKYSIILEMKKGGNSNA